MRIKGPCKDDMPVKGEEANIAPRNACLFAR